MQHGRIGRALAVGVICALAAAALPAVGAGPGSRGKGGARGRAVAAGAPSARAGGGKGASAARATRGATRPAGGRATRAGGTASYGRGTPTRVSGKATYGHAGYRYYGGHYYHGGYPYYPYAYPYSWYWPYYWGGFYAYGYPTVYGYGPVIETRAAPGTPAAVETDVKPKKAEVWVDGRLVGQARDFNGKWDLLFVRPGEHEFEFRAQGRATLRLRFDLRAGGHYRIARSLREGEGIDEEDPWPDAADPEPLAGAQPVEKRAPEGGGSVPTGLLKVHASPADAAVYLDGEFLARADELTRLHGALPVASGRHVIEVVRPGYAPETREVEIGQGEPTRVEIALDRR